MTDVFDLITPVPALVEQFKPRLKYPLIDKSALSDSELASLTNLVAAVFRIEHPASLDAIGGLAEPARRVAGRAARPTPDVRAVDRGHMWIEATLMPKAEDRIVLPRIDGLPELNVMLAERLEEWAHAYKAEGKAKGKGRGESRGERVKRWRCRKLLKKRFGAVPAEVLAKISAASLEQIEAWLDQVLDADESGRHLWANLQAEAARVLAGGLPSLRSASTSPAIRHVARPITPDRPIGTAHIATRLQYAVGHPAGGLVAKAARVCATGIGEG
jgi:hypothetical protein